jgi:membrane protein DedA with SNARE-associated domain
MAFGRFLALNLAATLPKVAGLMALGWAFGEISGRVTDWLSGLSILLVVALLAVLLSLVLRKGKPQ